MVAEMVAAVVVCVVTGMTVLYHLGVAAVAAAGQAAAKGSQRWCSVSLDVALATPCYYCCYWYSKRLEGAGKQSDLGPVQRLVHLGWDYVNLFGHFSSGSVSWLQDCE